MRADLARMWAPVFADPLAPQTVPDFPLALLR